MKPPAVETGWSSAHDRERKLIHDFSNLLQELLFARELQEPRLVEHYLHELRAKYKAALKK